MSSPRQLTNRQVAHLLRQVAAVLEVKGENRFRIRAYDNAADAIENSASSVLGLFNQNKLSSIGGIGVHLQAHLADLFTHGHSKHFDHLKRQVPAGMFPLLDLPGVGPKKAYKLAKKFKLTNESTALSQINKFASSGQIALIPGFGEQSQQDILSSIELQQSVSDARIRIDHADAISAQIISYLSQCPAVEEISVLGSLRRRLETIGDLDIGVATNKPAKLLDHIRAYSSVTKIIAAGPKLIRFHHQSGFGIDVKIVSPESWGSLLQHFTGSKAHNIKLREHALNIGLSLSEYGIKKKKNLVKFREESAFYHHLHMDWIPPELREDRGEIECALQHKLPSLVNLDEIQGDLHTHTNYAWISSHDSGIDSAKTMVQAAQQLGYSYLALGDHHPSLTKYSPRQLMHLVQKRSDQFSQLCTPSFKVFVTLEVDIRANGSLALPDSACSSLDFLIASIHSSFRQSKNDLTIRLIRAIAHPQVKIIGHPTARLVQKRSGMELDWDRIFSACLQFHTALEINAQPSRLDLPPEIIRAAVTRGVLLAINTDSHSATQLPLMTYGIDIARRGWVQAKSIVNTWPASKISAWLQA